MASLKPHVCLHTFGMPCQRSPWSFLPGCFQSAPCSHQAPEHCGVASPQASSSLPAGNSLSNPHHCLLLMVLVLYPEKGEALCAVVLWPTHQFVKSLSHPYKQSLPGCQSSGGGTAGTQLLSCPSLLPWATAGFGCSMEEPPKSKL